MLKAACGNGPPGPCVRQFYAGGKISACCLVLGLCSVLLLGERSVTLIYHNLCVNRCFPGESGSASYVIS